MSARRLRGVLGVLLAASTASCVPPAAPAASAAPTYAAWRSARLRLAEIRAQASRGGPRTMRLALALREPRTGRTLEARGAVAVSPPEALRMILLGPGGATALDLWVRGEQFRFAIPAIDLLRRGDASTPRQAMRGLPVEFLRWWLLRPASGTLLWHTREEGGERFFLRDGDATIELFAAPGEARVWARRTTWDGAAGERRRVDEEIMEADRMRCGSVRYQQASTGLAITVKCEGEETERAPSARAFVDPDAPPSSAEGS
jgi:hypothetical protein